MTIHPSSVSNTDKTCQRRVSTSRYWQLQPMHVTTIDTRLDNDPTRQQAEAEVRVADFAVNSTRNWFQKHLTWALHNHRRVVVEPIPPEELDLHDWRQVPQGATD